MSTATKGNVRSARSEVRYYTSRLSTEKGKISHINDSELHKKLDTMIEAGNQVVQYLDGKLGKDNG